jgi:hypothetical protein
MKCCGLVSGWWRLAVNIRFPADTTPIEYFDAQPPVPLSPFHADPISRHEHTQYTGLSIISQTVALSCAEQFDVQLRHSNTNSPRTSTEADSKCRKTESSFFMAWVLSRKLLLCVSFAALVFGACASTAVRKSRGGRVRTRKRLHFDPWWEKSAVSHKFNKLELETQCIKTHTELLSWETYSPARHTTTQSAPNIGRDYTRWQFESNAKTARRRRHLSVESWRVRATPRQLQ